jgi:hypothetical protein
MRGKYGAFTEKYYRSNSRDQQKKKKEPFTARFRSAIAQLLHTVSLFESIVVTAEVQFNVNQPTT